MTHTRSNDSNTGTTPTPLSQVTFHGGDLPLAGEEAALAMSTPREN
jgi:hypothetical protein